MSTLDSMIFMSMEHLWLFAGVGLVVVVLSTLKVLFGSYSLPFILSNYKKQKLIDETYAAMFRSRENFCFHINSARSRGDAEEAKRLARDLIELDKEIATMESTHFGHERD